MQGHRGGGYVLAGGLSRRMGRDKALLEVAGMTLVERAVRTLEALRLDVRVVCSSQAQARLVPSPTLVDREPGRGPIMGLCSALQHSGYEDNWVHCCDMPLLPARLLDRLSDFKRGFEVVVPADPEGRIQPLCGFYSRDSLEVLEEQLRRGVRSILDVLKSDCLKVKVVSSRALGVDADAFLNINDQTSLQNLEARLKDLPNETIPRRNPRL